MSALLLHMILNLILPDPSANRLLQEEKIYTVSEVSVKPEPLNGLKEFQDRWSKKVKYPQEALKKKIQGMVFIEFIVKADGSIVDANVKRGLGYGCDEAALKGFEELSTEGWKPGVRLGHPVKVKMVLPFFFRIVEQ